jgi:outer membrane beta-barrel protein
LVSSPPTIYGAAVIQLSPRSLAACVVAAVVMMMPAVATAQGGDEDLLEDLGGAEPAPPEPTAPPAAPEPEESKGAIDAQPTGEESDRPKEVTGPAQAPAATDKIKSVQPKPVLKKGRAELSAFAGLSLNDAYYQHLTFNGSAIYYLHDSFGIGLGADYLYAHIRLDNVTVVRQSLTSVPAVFEHPWLLAHLDSYWVPIYGKVSLFQNFIVHFELYASAGLGAAFPGERTVPEANAGVGQRFFLGDWLALRFEVRDHVFVDTQNVAGEPQSDIQNYILFYAGASFYLPPSFEYSYR